MTTNTHRQNPGAPERRWLVALITVSPMLLAGGLAVGAGGGGGGGDDPLAGGGKAAPAATATSAPTPPPPPPVDPAVEIEALRADITALSMSLDETAEALEKAKREPSGTIVTLSLMAEGKRVYHRACVSCHGHAGDGKGPAARYQDPKPRDFTTGDYKFRSTVSGVIPTDEDIARTVREGVPGTAMPAWGRKLSPYQLRAVVAYIKGFAPRFSEDEIYPEDVLAIPTEAPKATKDSIFAGEQIYKLFKCWDCHGTKGKGKGPSAKTLKDSKDDPIKAWNFTTGLYKGGKSGIAIYRTFATGLDGTPMPSYNDVMLFGSEAMSDASMVAEIERHYGMDETEELKAWLAAEPSSEALGGMDEAALAAFVENRKWALVHYVQSLTKKRGVLDYLFRDKPGRYDVPY